MADNTRPRLDRFRYYAADEGEGLDPAAALRGAVPPELEHVAATPFNSDEAAARFYLDALLAPDDRPAMRGVVAPERTERVPDLGVIKVGDSPATKTRLVSFGQTHEDIPVFGARAVVELTADRELVAAEGELGDVSGISPEPRLSQHEALARVERLTGAQLADEPVKSQLTWFRRADDETWHLAWLLYDLPAEPPEIEPGGVAHDHGLGPSPRDECRVNYLVDAHNGEVLYYFSARPTLTVPARCRGIDEDGGAQQFWGNEVDEGYEMFDPLRRTRTFDLSYEDLERATAPSSALASDASDWGESNPGAVSAHVNAMRVHDFYKSVLQRNGIDDAGMDLESIVHCTYRSQPGSQVWANAVWHDGRMWYGQQPVNGRLVSMSRHLDIIAHELTHGVIDHSSQLVYRDESGALNESFADIFGVIIRNWYLAADRSDVGTWSWEIGSGFRPGGGPLRDLSDPTRTGDPDRYEARYQGASDYGGVHTNSNIHNKVAYHLLTMKEDDERHFPVEDAAVLLYLCMVRISAIATFDDALQTLIGIAKTYYGGESEVRGRKVAAIVEAYARVGIVSE
jgi:bacillolysin